MSNSQLQSTKKETVLIKRCVNGKVMTFEKTRPKSARANDLLNPNSS